MTGLIFPVALPLAAAVLLLLMRNARLASWVNCAVSVLNFVLALSLFGAEQGRFGLLHLDHFNIYLIALTTFVTATTAWFSTGYITTEIQNGRMTMARVRVYHAMYQVMSAAMLLALLADNIGLMWVAVEATALATVPMVALYRTRASIKAAWKFFILCGVGVGLALFGTILLYLAATQVLGAGLDAMSWDAVQKIAPRMNGPLLNLAFVFLLIGYGTKAGLAPLHAWLPDAHAEGPTPICAILSGLVLNVAFAAILRTRMLMMDNENTIAPNVMLLIAGSVSVLLAAFSLWQRRDVKRFFSWSSIEHMGIVALAFGLGGASAHFAGLLHMGGHALAKSAIFFGIGHAAQRKGGQSFGQIAGLTISTPVLGWSLALLIAAIAAIPPFVLFASEVIILGQMFRQLPWLLIPIGIGLIAAFAALVTRMQALCFGTPTPDIAQPPMWSTLGPVWLHIIALAGLGMMLPDFFVRWLVAIAEHLR